MQTTRRSLRRKRWELPTEKIDLTKWMTNRSAFPSRPPSRSKLLRSTCVIWITMARPKLGLRINYRKMVLQQKGIAQKWTKPTNRSNCWTNSTLWHRIRRARGKMRLLMTCRPSSTHYHSNPTPIASLTSSPRPAQLYSSTTTKASSLESKKNWRRRTWMMSLMMPWFSQKKSIQSMKSRSRQQRYQRKRSSLGFFKWSKPSNRCYPCFRARHRRKQRSRQRYRLWWGQLLPTRRAALHHPAQPRTTTIWPISNCWNTSSSSKIRWKAIRAWRRTMSSRDIRPISCTWSRR